MTQHRHNKALHPTAYSFARRASSLRFQRRVSLVVRAQRAALWQSVSQPIYGAGLSLGRPTSAAAGILYLPIAMFSAMVSHFCCSAASCLTPISPNL